MFTSSIIIFMDRLKKDTIIIGLRVRFKVEQLLRDLFHQLRLDPPDDRTVVTLREDQAPDRHSGLRHLLLDPISDLRPVALRPQTVFPVDRVDLHLLETDIRVQDKAVREDIREVRVRHSDLVIKVDPEEAVDPAHKVAHREQVMVVTPVADLRFRAV